MEYSDELDILIYEYMIKNGYLKSGESFKKHIKDDVNTNRQSILSEWYRQFVETAGVRAGSPDNVDLKKRIEMTMIKLERKKIRNIMERSYKTSNNNANNTTNNIANNNNSNNHTNNSKNNSAIQSKFQFICTYNIGLDFIKETVCAGKYLILGNGIISYIYNMLNNIIEVSFSDIRMRNLFITNQNNTYRIAYIADDRCYKVLELVDGGVSTVLEAFYKEDIADIKIFSNFLVILDFKENLILIKIPSKMNNQEKNSNKSDLIEFQNKDSNQIKLKTFFLKNKVQKICAFDNKLIYLRNNNLYKIDDLAEIYNLIKKITPESSNSIKKITPESSNSIKKITPESSNSQSDSQQTNFQSTYHSDKIDDNLIFNLSTNFSKQNIPVKFFVDNEFLFIEGKKLIILSKDDLENPSLEFIDIDESFKGYSIVNSHLVCLRKNELLLDTQIVPIKRGVSVHSVNINAIQGVIVTTEESIIKFYGMKS